MKSVEAGVGIEPAYTDLQCDRPKKCPEKSGHKRFGNCFVAQVHGTILSHQLSLGGAAFNEPWQHFSTAPDPPHQLDLDGLFVGRLNAPAQG